MVSSKTAFRMIAFALLSAGIAATAQTFTTLHRFDGTEGDFPNAGLVQATDGNFYGTTTGGGDSFGGNVFRITPSGTVTSLYSFCSGCTDGAAPLAGLVQGTDGDLYGTTSEGGTGSCVGGCGTVFKITPSGTLTTLHSFDDADGSFPSAGLIQAVDGNFYGTTNGGGPYGSACGGGCGTVFKITPEGTLTTLYSFCSQSNCTDGYRPYAELVEASDGNLYGATGYGGADFACFDGCGTVFKITPSGTLTTLYNFCSQGDCSDGFSPRAALIQATDGNFYGTTGLGGAGPSCGSDSGCGTVFRLSVGLAPFVETLPTSAQVGASVKILGTNLSGASSVTFNGTAANFTVVSSSEITATVPSGATSGPVQVTTPNGLLLSNVPFRVRP